MQAGLLKYLIEIQKVNTNKDIYGAESESWVTNVNCKADIKFNSGNKVVQNSEVVITNQLTFVIRYYVDINESMRIIYDKKKYRIISIDSDNRLMKKTIIAELINE
nr:phage head closure protein [uncultured Bacteroides sp.]